MCKSKIGKKLTSCLTVILLSFSCLTGCGDQVNKEYETISFMLIALGDNVLNNEGSEKVISEYEEHTGIHVDWIFVENDGYLEKLKYVLMDKTNIPMIITYGGELDGDAVKEAQKGTFWDLAPFLEQEDKLPNLSKANDDILKSLTVDGKLIGIYRAREVGRYGFSYRQDWAEAVGVTSEPSTIEDVYELLYRFTWSDPDGNGKDDTFGLEMSSYTGVIDIIQTWFGCGNEWVEADGKLIPVHETEEYMTAMEWMRKIYEEGLIRADWPLVDSDISGEAVKKGEAGAIVNVIGDGARAWEYFVDNQIMAVNNSEETASMNLVGPIENHTLATSGYNGFFAVTKEGAKTEKDVWNCLTFLDRMCDPGMLLLADYGLEGVTYDVNEQNEIIKNTTNSIEESPQYGLNQSVCYIPDLKNTMMNEPQSEIMLAQEKAYERNRATAVTNPAIGYYAESEVFAEKGTVLESILEEARTMYICGQIDKQEWQNKIEEWYKNGGTELIKEINALHNANK